ncbi:MAG: hypothetical protein K0U39_00885 [Alphaproteobacteria bacterium]|nr:hypothetical protein [Alphaproteobacteria bacterium]
MWYDKYFAALPESEKKLLQSYFEKIEKGLTLPRQEAEKAYKAMGKLSQAITDSNFIEKFAKILSTAFQLTPQEITCLKGMMQSSRNITSFTKDEEYLTLIKIAKTLTNYSNQFRARPSLNTLFNQLNNDDAFKKIIGIIKSANLTDVLAVELVKIQYKSNYTVSFRTAELMTHINNAGKLSELPEKAFDRLAERLITNINKEINNQQDRIADASKKSIFKKILKNQNVSDSEAKKLVNIYYLLSAVNKISILPKQVGDKLTQLDKQRLSKQKSSTPFNLQKLLEKVGKGEKLTPFQALYLHGYITKTQLELPPSERTKLDKALQKIPADLLKRAENYQKELVNSKTLATIKTIMQQIRDKQYANQKEGVFIKFPYTNAEIRQTHNYMEIRISKAANKKIFTADGINALIQAGTLGMEKVVRHHHGRDGSGHGTHDSILRYEAGFSSKPTIAKIYDVTKDTSNKDPEILIRNPQDITILEYHPNHSILLTIFRHVQKVFVEPGVDLKPNMALGTYAIQPQYMKTDAGKKRQAKIIKEKKDYTGLVREHLHIARKSMTKAQLDQLTKDQWANQLKSLTGGNITTDDSATRKEARRIIKDETGFMLPLSNPDDYHIIALFTEDHPLNKKLRADVSNKWGKNVQSIAKQNNIASVSKDSPELAKMRLLIAEMKKASYFDYLMLDTIADMLEKVRILLLQVDAQNKQIRELTEISTEARTLAVGVYKEYVSKDVRIITE